MAQTSGQLQQAIDIICRGEVTVVTDGTVTAGDYLDASTTSGDDGMVASVTTTPTRLIALQSVVGTMGSPVPLVALLF